MVMAKDRLFRSGGFSGRRKTARVSGVPAFEMIAESERLGFLQNLEGARLRGGVTNIVDSLFTEVNEEGDEVAPWADDREDEELDKLTVE